MAQASMIRINESSHRTLRQLAEAMGESMQAVLNKAIEEYRRKQFFEQLDESFAVLKADSSAWQEELKERSLTAGTLSDGLDADEVWTEDGRLAIGG
ncbi:MAG: toxin-antitoxin system protein [Pyrinomonadaceae bacterium]